MAIFPMNLKLGPNQTLCLVFNLLSLGYIYTLHKGYVLLSALSQRYLVPVGPVLAILTMITWLTWYMPDFTNIKVFFSNLATYKILARKQFETVNYPVPQHIC